MATIERYKDILVVIGSDVIVPKTDGTVRLKRSGVRQALFSRTNPLGDLSGKFDFIVCFTIRSPSADYSTLDHSLTPRPLRGIVQLPGKYTDNPVSHIPSIMGWFNHECGHYWLAPRGRIRTQDGEIEIPKVRDIETAINDGGPVPNFPIIGRGNSHWSPYMETGDSCMEGVDWSSVTRHWGQDHAKGRPIEGTGYSFHGALHDSGCVYGPLDLFIMGADGGLDPQQTSFRFIRPQWITPLPFHTGLYAELDDGHRWFFGFHEGPQTIHAAAADPQAPTSFLRTDKAVLSKPFNPFDRVGLRVVQRGNLAHLQYRVWPGPVYWGRGQWPERLFGWLPEWAVSRFSSRPDVDLRDVFHDLSPGPMEVHHDPRQGWDTYATVPGRVMRMGLASRSLGDSKVYCRISARVGLGVNSTVTEIPLPRFEQEFPKAGPVLTAGEQLVMPFRRGNQSHSYQETTTLSEAPKLVIDRSALIPAATSDDYAFGGIVDLESCLFVSWAGGRGRKVTTIGEVQEVAFDDFILPWDDADQQIRQAPPVDGYYRTLVCLVAKDPLEATTPRRDYADVARQHWEAAFHAMSQQRLEMTTAIDPL